MRFSAFIPLICLLAPAAGAAALSGIIRPANRVKAIGAFKREGAELFKIKNRYHAGRIDAKTGRFEVPDLPDGTYQLLLDCGDAKIEGVHLRIDDEEDEATFDYRFKTGRLDTKRLDLSEFFDPDEVVPPDRKRRIVGKLTGLPKLLEKLRSLRQVDRFCDHLRPLHAHGTKTRAFVLVEKARLRNFYAGQGQAIYRVEIWPFRRYGAAWDKPAKGVRVLQRHRFNTKAGLRAFGAFFEPALGGFRILNGVSVGGIEYTIPKTWDDALGKVPGRAVTAWEAKDE
jgi:hypothetical protein